jgi:hypothetical protein
MRSGTDDIDLQNEPLGYDPEKTGIHEGLALAGD